MRIKRGKEEPCLPPYAPQRKEGGDKNLLIIHSLVIASLCSLSLHQDHERKDEIRTNVLSFLKGNLRITLAV